MSKVSARTRKTGQEGPVQEGHLGSERTICTPALAGGQRLRARWCSVEGQRMSHCSNDLW